jgi:hypothetical protein
MSNLFKKLPNEKERNLNLAINPDGPKIGEYYRVLLDY